MRVSFTCNFTIKGWNPQFMRGFEAYRINGKLRMEYLGNNRFIRWLSA